MWETRRVIFNFQVGRRVPRSPGSAVLRHWVPREGDPLEVAEVKKIDYFKKSVFVSPRDKL